MRGGLSVAHLLTLDEAAAALRVSRRTLERRVAGGHIAVYRDGGRIAVTESELRRYVLEHTTARRRPAKPTRHAGRRLPDGERLWD